MARTNSETASTPQSRRNLLPKKKNHKLEPHSSDAGSTPSNSRSRSGEKKRKTASASTLVSTSRLSSEFATSPIAHKFETPPASHIGPSKTSHDVVDQWLSPVSAKSATASFEHEPVARELNIRSSTKIGGEGKKTTNVAGKLRDKLSTASVGKGRRVDGGGETASEELPLQLLLESENPNRAYGVRNVNNTPTSGRRRKSYPLVKLSEQNQQGTQEDALKPGVESIHRGIENVPPFQLAKRFSSDVASSFEVEPASDGPFREERSGKSLRFMTRGASRTVPASHTDIKNILSPRRKTGQYPVPPSDADPTSNDLFDSLPASMGYSTHLELDTTERQSVTGRSLPKNRHPGKRQRRLIKTRKGERNSPQGGPSHSCEENEMRAESATDSTTETVLDRSKEDETAWLTHQVQLLEARLAESEEELRQLLAASEENERRFQSEVGRLKRILGAVDQAQELRYNSLLDVFTDNFRAMGTVEAQFEQMMGARHRQMQTSSKGQMLFVLWKIIDFLVKGLFQLLQLVARSYKYLKGRNGAPPLRTTSTKH